MKKLLTCMAAALIAVACYAQVDYSRHMYRARIFRVSLGAGNAPDAGEVAALRLQNGDMIMNTDDNVLFIMHAPAAYTRITADGEVTLEGMNIDGDLVVAGTLTVQDSPSVIHGLDVTAPLRVRNTLYVQDATDENRNVMTVIDQGASRGRLTIGDIFLGYGTLVGDGLLRLYDGTTARGEFAPENQAFWWDGSGVISNTLTAGVLVSDDGSDIELLDADNIASGRIGLARLPAMTDGQLLVGTTSDSNATVQTVGGELAMSVNGEFTINDRAVVGAKLPIMETGRILVGNSDSDSNATVVVMSGDATIDETGNVTVTADIPRNTDVFGSAAITLGDITAGQLITTNYITMRDAAGVTKSGYALTRVWVSETAYGSASTNNIEDVTLDGTEVEDVLGDGVNFWQVTPDSGIITATIEATAAGTNHLNVAVGAWVTSEEIVLTD